MRGILDRQKAAFERDRDPTCENRIDRLNRAIELLRSNRQALCEAMHEDFGGRSVSMALAADIASSIAALRHARDNLEQWMKPEHVSIDDALEGLGARAYVRRQPKGVVGIISPWNFPIGLVFCPLAGVLAAGNRAMIKPSELTPATSALLSKLVPEFFSDEEIAVICGGVDIGKEFAAMPFDHLLFTGSTWVAKDVMASAARNLVPVTLELGGKSPVVLGETADIPVAAIRTMYGKMLNAGQICLAPDYALVPNGTAEAFVDALTGVAEKMYPDGLINNDDYVSIISSAHYERLIGYIEDARDKGAEISVVDPVNEIKEQGSRNRLLPHIITNVNDNMLVMKEEIFGPILPVMEYDSLEDAIAYINDRPHPLGLYLFAQKSNEIDNVIRSTISGGMTINDVMFHAAQEDLPLGGIGASGMGAYHGKPGFDEFSHSRAIYRQTDTDVLALFRPPYGDEYKALVDSLIVAS